MRLLWTAAKITLALVLVVPIAIVVLATALGVFGALLGLAVLALKLVVMGLLAVGAFKLFAYLVKGSPRPAAPVEPTPLPPRDPHYEAAMRELDSELGMPR